MPIETPASTPSEVIPGSGLTYKEVLNATSDCIFIHDSDGAVVYVNSTTETTYGYSLEELRQLGTNRLSRGAAPYSSVEAMEFIRQAIAEGECVFPWHARRRNGELFWVEVALRASRLAGRTWVIAVVRDVEQQRRAENALRASEDRLARIFNNSSNGLAITEFDSGRIIDVNRTWETMSGISRDRAVGETAADLGLWARPEDREVSRRQLRAAGRLRDFETTLVTTSGPRLFQLAAEAFTIDDRRAVLWEFNDIDDRRRLEMQLFQAQKLESVGRLAGGVAHDFNNMLSVILGHVDLLMADFAPHDARRASLAAVRQAAERSTDLTRQLLAFARQQRVTPAVLDLNRAVESMLKMLQRLIGEHIELVCRPDSALWPVLMDPVQVDQILANLCVNARDAIDGVGRIVIETSRIWIDDATALRHGAGAGDYARLSVSDTGSGIPPELLSKIFEPFFTTKPVGAGTGLGLATVHGIVLQNRGFITVDSRIGGGTTFHLHLPKTDGAAEEPAADAAAEQRSTGRGERVLLVEDEATVLEMMKMMISLIGYDVIQASSPRQALSLAADPKVGIDVVVSDVIMPQMNGRQLIAELRALRPGLKCLFVSGYTADVLAEHGVMNDGDEFLSKPFSRNSLAAALDRILGHR